MREYPHALLKLYEPGLFESMPDFIAKGRIYFGNIKNGNPPLVIPCFRFEQFLCFANDITERAYPRCRNGEAFASGSDVVGINQSFQGAFSAISVHRTFSRELEHAAR